MSEYVVKVSEGIFQDEVCEVCKSSGWTVYEEWERLFCSVKCLQEAGLEVCCRCNGYGIQDLDVYCTMCHGDGFVEAGEIEYA